MEFLQGSEHDLARFAEWMSEQGLTKFSDLEMKIPAIPPWKQTEWI